MRGTRGLPAMHSAPASAARILTRKLQSRGSTLSLEDKDGFSIRQMDIVPIEHCSFKFRGRPFLEKLPNARCRSLLERHDDNESIHGATLKQRSCPGSRVAQRLSGTDPGGADKNPLRSSPHSNLRVSRLLRAPTGRMIAAYSKDWSSP